MESVALNEQQDIEVVIRVAHGKELIKVLKKKSADLVNNGLKEFASHQIWMEVFSAY